MKKISTPSLKRQEAAVSTFESTESIGPSKSTLAFIRSFARACKSIQLVSNDMSVIVVN